ALKSKNVWVAMPVLSACVLAGGSLVRVTAGAPVSGSPASDRDGEPDECGDQHRDVGNTHQEPFRPVDDYEGEECTDGDDERGEGGREGTPPQVPRCRERREAPVEPVERALELLEPVERPLSAKPL